LIDKLGFERFTFKKLADALGSTEASVYRYFENKHRLLVYLVSWYWSWIHYRITYDTNNITDCRDRLRRVIAVLADSATYDRDWCMNRLGLDDLLLGTRDSLGLQPRDPTDDRTTEASASSPEVQNAVSGPKLAGVRKALRARGDVTVWISEEVCRAWTPMPAGTRGGQRIYSDIAIQTVLTLRLLFHLPLRATEGFVASIFKLAGLNLGVAHCSM
jgi:AcrR family transcriptional regulator